MDTWTQEQQRQHNLASFRWSEPARKPKRPRFTVEQERIAAEWFARIEARRGRKRAGNGRRNGDSASDRSNVR